MQQAFTEQTLPKLPLERETAPSNPGQLPKPGKFSGGALEIKGPHRPLQPLKRLAPRLQCRMLNQGIDLLQRFCVVFIQALVQGIELGGKCGRRRT